MRNARILREARGLSQSDVFLATRINDTHLSRFERGLSELSLSNLQKLATLYGCTLDDLVAEVPDGDTDRLPSAAPVLTGSAGAGE